MPRLVHVGARRAPVNARSATFTMEEGQDLTCHVCDAVFVPHLEDSASFNRRVFRVVGRVVPVGIIIVLLLAWFTATADVVSEAGIQQDILFLFLPLGLMGLCVGLLGLVLSMRMTAPRVRLERKSTQKRQFDTYHFVID